MYDFNKATRVFGMIKKTIRFKDTRIMIGLYKTLVRPHVEYCVSAWNRGTLVIASAVYAHTAYRRIRPAIYAGQCFFSYLLLKSCKIYASVSLYGHLCQYAVSQY